MNRNGTTHRGDPPIACSLPSDEFRRRGEEVAQLFENAREVKELEDGYSFEFPGDDASTQSLLEFVKGERRCCTSVTFELAFEPNQGPIRLRLRGSGEIKALIQTTLLGEGSAQ